MGYCSCRPGGNAGEGRSKTAPPADLMDTDQSAAQAAARAAHPTFQAHLFAALTCMTGRDVVLVYSVLLKHAVQPDICSTLQPRTCPTSPAAE